MPEAATDKKRNVKAVAKEVAKGNKGGGSTEESQQQSQVKSGGQQGVSSNEGNGCVASGKATSIKIMKIGVSTTKNLSVEMEAPTISQTI